MLFTLLRMRKRRNRKRKAETLINQQKVQDEARDKKDASRQAQPKPMWQSHLDAYLQTCMLPPDDVLPTLKTAYLEHVFQPFEDRQYKIEIAISSLMEKLARIDSEMLVIEMHAPNSHHELHHFNGDKYDDGFTNQRD